jgi:hypothetical protein
MGVRYSLKWLLAAMIYAALAAAAFTHTHWAYADLLWLVAVFSLVYTATLAVFSRGRQQGGAIGFVVASVLVMWALYSDDYHSLPTERLVSLLASLGDAPSDESQIPNPFSPPIAAPIAPGSLIEVDIVSPPPIRSLLPPSAPPVYGTPAIIDYARRMRQVRAANAVATLLAGLIGTALGVAAHRRANAKSSDHQAASP